MPLVPLVPGGGGARGGGRGGAELSLVLANKMMGLPLSDHQLIGNSAPDGAGPVTSRPFAGRPATIACLAANPPTFLAAPPQPP